MENREEQFEKMLAEVHTTYDGIVEKMEKLKSEGKTKTVSYRELMGNKLIYQTILNLYRSYGLTR